MRVNQGRQNAPWLDTRRRSSATIALRIRTSASKQTQNYNESRRKISVDHRLHVGLLHLSCHLQHHSHVRCSGGIGQATARALALEGCSIAVHFASDSSEPKAEALIAEITKHEGVKAAAFQADLSTYENAKSLHDRVVSKLGNPDIFFGNHGIAGKLIGPRGDIGQITPEMFEETWRTNTGTNFYVRVFPKFRSFAASRWSLCL